MKHNISISQALMPLRYYYIRSSVIIFTLITIVIAYTNHDNGSATTVQNHVASTSSSIAGFFSSPGDTLKALSADISHNFSIMDENSNLRNEVESLKKWQIIAMQTSTQNNELKKLLNYTENTAQYTLSTRLITSSASPYGLSGVIAAGSKDGVISGAIAASEKGIIGRVSNAYPYSSSVIFITDIQSRIPAITAGRDEKFIVAGNNTPVLDLMYLPEHHQLKPGDIVLTSGDGGVIPPGLVIGEILEVDGALKLVPSVDFDRISFVSVLNYTPPVDSEVPVTTTP